MLAALAVLEEIKNPLVSNNPHTPLASFVLIAKK